MRNERPLHGIGVHIRPAMSSGQNAAPLLFPRPSRRAGLCRCASARARLGRPRRGSGIRGVFLLHAVVAVISFAFGSGATAAVCASTFGEGSSFGAGAYAVTGSATGTRFDRAFPFTPTVDCRLGTIEVAFHLDSGTNALRIAVVEDSSGLPSSSVVESTTVLDEMTSDPGGSIVTGIFTGASLLSGGSTYWIVVEAEPVTGDTSAVWHQNDLAITGVRGVRINGGSWQGSLGALGAFRVAEAALPVPAMAPWGLAALGAALLLSAGLSLVAHRR